MDYVLDKTGIPCSHLFSASSGRRLPNSRSIDANMFSSTHTYTPRLNPNSVELARRERSASIPIHERLWAEQDKWLRKRAMKKQELEQKELAHCTFTPNRLRHDGNMRYTPRSNAVGGDGNNGPSVVYHDNGKGNTSFRPQSRSNLAYNSKEITTHDSAIEGVEEALLMSERAIQQADESLSRIKRQQNEQPSEPPVQTMRNQNEGVNLNVRKGKNVGRPPPVPQ